MTLHRKLEQQAKMKHLRPCSTIRRHLGGYSLTAVARKPRPVSYDILCTGDVVRPAYVRELSYDHLWIDHLAWKCIGLDSHNLKQMCGKNNS